MKQQNLHQLVKCSDNYVAFVSDILHVIASGTTMSEVYKQLKAKKIPDATITYIPPVDKALTLSTPSLA